MRRASALPVAIAGLLASPGAALAAAPIEGSWPYDGGEVLVEAAGAGSFTGTVVRDTQRSACVHHPGEIIWDIHETALPTAYTGGHDWFDTATCTLRPTRGRASWTIVSTDPQRYLLRFCTVPPEDTTSPPEADPGCQDVERLRPPQPAPTFATTVVLPAQGKRGCLSRRHVRIRLRRPPADPLVAATLRVDGELVRTVKQDRITAPVDLRGLPKGRYTVSITASTASGKVIEGGRMYRTCAPGRNH